MFNDWIPVKLEDLPAKLPKKWIRGRQNCVPDEINYNPSSQFDSGFVPLVTVRDWQLEKLVKDITLYPYDITLGHQLYCLDFLVLGFNTCAEPHWISAVSITFKANGFTGAHDKLSKLNIRLKKPKLPVHWANEPEPIKKDV